MSWAHRRLHWLQPDQLHACESSWTALLPWNTQVVAHLSLVNVTGDCTTNQIPMVITLPRYCSGISAHVGGQDSTKASQERNPGLQIDRHEASLHIGYYSTITQQGSMLCKSCAGGSEYYRLYCIWDSAACCMCHDAREHMSDSFCIKTCYKEKSNTIRLVSRQCRW